MLIVLKGLRLEHAAVLHLLQGASYRQLLDDVLLVVPGAALPVRLCITETIPLHKPPFIIGKTVFARVMNNPNDTPDEVLQQELLLAGLAS